MPWTVRFRGKDFIGTEGWDPDYEFEVREELTDVRELSGSAEIILHLKGDFINDVTIHETTDPDEFPFDGIHGNHKELGEVFMFSGFPDHGDLEMIAFYSNDIFPDKPFNDQIFTGDGS